MNKHLDCASLLTSEVGCANNKKETALMHAAKQGGVDLVKCLSNEIG